MCRRIDEAIDRHDAGMLVPLPDYGGDLWVKVIAMLQQNWALVAPIAPAHAQVYFLDDHGVMFDALAFPTEADAVDGLKWNGFQRFAEAPDLQAFLYPPSTPFFVEVSPDNPAYASGRHWREPPPKPKNDAPGS